MTAGAQTVRLSYLPLASLGTATTAMVSIEGRYARPRRGDNFNEALSEIAWTFALPGQWTAIDPSLVDYDPTTGELTLPWNPRVTGANTDTGASELGLVATTFVDVVISPVVMRKLRPAWQEGGGVESGS